MVRYHLLKEAYVVHCETCQHVPRTRVYIFLVDVVDKLWWTWGVIRWLVRYVPRKGWCNVYMHVVTITPWWFVVGFLSCFEEVLFWLFKWMICDSVCVLVFTLVEFFGKRISSISWIRFLHISGKVGDVWKRFGLNALKEDQNCAAERNRSCQHCKWIWRKQHASTKRSVYRGSKIYGSSGRSRHCDPRKEGDNNFHFC